MRQPAFAVLPCQPTVRGQSMSHLLQILLDLRVPVSLRVPLSPVADHTPGTGQLPFQLRLQSESADSAS